MLILNRKVNESIMIGDDIEIIVLQKKDKFKNLTLGINAPKNISVHRKEIYERLKNKKCKK